MLTQENLHELFDYNKDTGVFIWREKRTGKAFKFSVAGRVDSDGYVVIRIGKKIYKAHRLAWLYVYGEIPNIQIDHKNGIRKDNGILNLRMASGKDNAQNATIRKDNSSGFKGVNFDSKSNLWVVRCQSNNKRKFIGRFKTAHDGFLAYSEYARKEHGQFYPLRIEQ